MKREKTAVEWLEEQLIKEGIYVGEQLYIKAKAMEKEQLKVAYSEDRPMLSYFEDGSAFEEYYNETYGNENEGS